MENLPPASLVREHRLYQADWLLRFYHFQLDELSFQPGGNLSTEMDPKMAWARKHPEIFPIEVNRAEYEELIRIPGVGIRSAERIIQARRAQGFSDPDDLRKLRISLKRAAPYILVNGKTVKFQPSLFVEPEGVL
jgi:predicted DNA-binding helix-hairpin-helix protein